MIIDCHTHWGMAWQARDGADPSRWLAVLDRYGVDRAVVLPHKGLMHDGLIAQDHDEMAKVCGQSGGRMIPFATAHITFSDEGLAELRRCLETLQFRGIKFHPWLQGVSPGDAAMDNVCELAAQLNVPILFHDGTPPFSLPSQIALLARRHPNTNIILGHCGLFEHWREAASALNACDNLWGCLCSPHVAGLRGLVQRCDAARLVWGTDQGYGLADCYSYRLPLMNLLNLSDDTREAIFHTNPARMLQF